MRSPITLFWEKGDDLMYMRLFQMKIKPEQLPAYRQFYDETVIPEFQKMEGCLYATLIRSGHHEDECISMTLWDTPAHAEACEQSRVFEKLLQEEKQYLADSSEWKIQLSKELKLEYTPVPEEPIVKAFNVAAGTDEKIPAQETGPMYLRIVSLRIQPGKIEKFRRIYTDEIIPVLRSVKGCRYAYVTESAKEKNDVISVTIWDSKQDAENYETSGVFAQLVEKVKDTFSDLYQWKMGLQKEFGGKVATSEDLKVEHYSIVTGKSFK